MRQRKKPRFMQSNWFEYFYYFLALSLLVAFTAGYALYSSSSSLLWKDAIQNNSNTLQLLKNGQEIVLSEVNKAMENVLLDSSFLNYTDEDRQSDIYGRLQYQHRLDNVVLASDHIHSLYIYYTGPRVVLSSVQGPVPLGGFEDRAFAESLAGEPSPKSIVRSRSLPGISSAQREPVITIVKTLPIIYKGKQPAAYVVINIKGDYLVRIMNSLNTNKDAHLVVTDREGTILSHKSSDEAPSFGGPPGTFDVSRMHGASGSLFARVQGTESLVCYVTSEPSGWMYIYTVPKSAVTHSLRLWSNATVVICLIAILLSLAGSALLSRRVFHPLERLLSTLRGAHPDTPSFERESEKEMTQIERNVGRLIDRNRDLSMMLKDYEIQSRNTFLLRLADGGEQVSAQTLERLAYYGVRLEERGSFIVAIVSMDDFSRFSAETNEAERNTLLLQLFERLQKEAFEKMSWQGYLVETEPGEIALVLQPGSANAEAGPSMSQLRSWFRQLHESLYALAGMTFTLGVSTLHEGLQELSECYGEAEAAVRQKLVYGYNNVIFYDAVRTEGGAALYPLGIERNLLAQFKLGSREGVSRGLRDFEAYMLEHHAGRIEVVRHYFLQLFSSSLRSVYEIDANLGFQPVIQQLRHTDLLELETMQRMVGYMQKLYDTVLDQLEQKRNRKNKELADGINRYVEAHLGGDLSIEKLSDTFAISTSHLRKIYKEETGTTLKEMIGQRRIAKAKALLGDPQIRIGDIALEVGYLTVQSFTKAFKLETGKTPGEYRDQLLRENLKQ